jgi:hypothetical protein
VKWQGANALRSVTTTQANPLLLSSNRARECGEGRRLSLPSLSPQSKVQYVDPTARRIKNPHLDLGHLPTKWRV